MVLRWTVMTGILSWWDGVELWLTGRGFVLRVIVVMPVVLALAYGTAVVLDGCSAGRSPLAGFSRGVSVVVRKISHDRNAPVTGYSGAGAAAVTGGRHVVAHPLTCWASRHANGVRQQKWPHPGPHCRGFPPSPMSVVVADSQPVRGLVSVTAGERAYARGLIRLFASTGSSNPFTCGSPRKAIDEDHDQGVPAAPAAGNRRARPVRIGPGGLRAAARAMSPAIPAAPRPTPR